MFFQWADNRDPRSWAHQFRQRRFAFFRSLLDQLPDQGLKILDVGGTPGFWQRMTQDAPPWRVTLVNQEPALVSLPWLETLTGDARALPFPDRSFDVVFSSSVIEHVGDFSDQQRMADEVRRVAPRYFVQTPNFWFPLEPHFLFPGFQWLPLSVRAALLTRSKLGWMARQEVYADALATVRQIRLINAAELRRLFPDAHVYRERIGGLTKSLVAYGGWSALEPTAEGQAREPEHAGHPQQPPEH